MPILVHPYNTKLPVYEGTHLLEADLGLIGVVLQDPYQLERFWTIQALFAPVPQRRLGGLRAQLMDQYGFVTFLNQRDLELLLGLGVPGTVCPWLGSKYIAVGARDWCGLCVDEDDLLDDLQIRELRMRQTALSQQHTAQLPPGQMLLRLLHKERGVETEETCTLLWDMGYSDLEHLESRWDRTQRRVEWQQHYLPG